MARGHQHHCYGGSIMGTIFVDNLEPQSGTSLTLSGGVYLNLGCTGF